MAVSQTGDLYMLERLSNQIQRYNPGTDTWTNVMAGPPGGSFVYGNLEITNDGEFFVSKDNSSTLH